MAEKLEDCDLWLPAEFIDDGFFLDERRAATLMAETEGERGGGLVRENSSVYSYSNTMETESDEEDYIAGLTRKMSHSFIAEDNKFSFWDNRVLATSPQSTLCEAGILSASCAGRPNGGSEVYPPRSTFIEHRKEDAMDLLYAAAGEVLRKKQNNQRAHESRLLPLAHTKSSAAVGTYNNEVVARQQIQAAQFYKLKQQQLMKQQASSTWSKQNRSAAAINNRPHGSALSAWSPHQQQLQPSSGMRAVFLNSPGARRESAGTGVFLPRRAGSPTLKKPVCSTVLLPAKVIQALNLTLNDTGVQSRCPVYISRNNEMASSHGKSGHNDQKQSFHHHPPAIISGNKIRLPKEWTY